MKSIVSIEFEDEKSSEAKIHIEGVNEIQLFGAAKMIEQAGIEHMARNAMARAVEEAKKNGGRGIIQAPASIGDLHRGDA